MVKCYSVPYRGYRIVVYQDRFTVFVNGSISSFDTEREAEDFIDEVLSEDAA